MDRFPRRHVVVLARSSPSRLAYLEKTGIVVPDRVGPPHRPEVLYSWEQILEIRTISRLRQRLSFQTIRKIIQYFEEHGFGCSLRDKHLIITAEGVSWICPMTTTTPQVIQLAGKSNRQMGQFVLVPLDSLESSRLWAMATDSIANVVDFEYFRQKIRPR
ncbi:MAG: MerR family transcriptional regulator [Nodosilinea sp.]